MNDGASDNNCYVWTVVVGLALLAALAAMAIPNYTRPPGRRTSAKNACISNLKQIDGAVALWALENKLTATDTYSFTDTAILKFMRHSRLPECPHGGRDSTAPNVSSSPTCTIPGHTL